MLNDDKIEGGDKLVGELGDQVAGVLQSRRQAMSVSNLGKLREERENYELLELGLSKAQTDPEVVLELIGLRVAVPILVCVGVNVVKLDGIAALALR